MASEFDRDGIRQKLVQTFVQVLDLDASEVKDDSLIVDDLGADSLALVELLLAAEEEFELDIPDEAVENIKVFGEALSYILKRVQKQVDAPSFLYGLYGLLQ